MPKKATVLHQTSFDSKKKKTIPIEKGRWGGHVFIVSAKLIRGFTDLAIEGSSETEEKEKGKQKHVSRKRGNPLDVSVTVQLSAFTGCNVRKEALEFVSEARKGKTDYFYVGGKKLVSCELMLTNASVQEIEISPGGTWTNAKVALSFKQYDTGGTSVNDSSSSSSGGGGGSSGGGGGGGSSYVGSAGAGSNKASVKNSPPVITGDVSFKSIGNTIKNTYDKINAAKNGSKEQQSAAVRYIQEQKKMVQDKTRTSAVQTPKSLNLPVKPQARAHTIAERG